jgi:DNA polymerase III delta prime subunit
VSTLLPWPSRYLESAGWAGVARLATRCHALALRSELPGTLMLLGEPGLGREALAVELAASLICREGGGPGCNCPSCARVRRGVHPDIEVLDVLPDASEIKIEQTRDLVGRAAQLPYEGRRRAVIVASVHTPPLNAYAASSLLKALEEPPEHLTWILLAGNPSRVLPTIVSRATLVRVPPPARGDLLALLERSAGLTREEAERHLRTCLDDAALALAAAAGEEAAQVVAVRERVHALMAGDRLAALQLGVLGKTVPGGLAVLAQAMVAEASDAALDAEGVLAAAARLTTADRRRAVLHLDAESVTVGALAPLLRG